MGQHTYKAKENVMYTHGNEFMVLLTANQETKQGEKKIEV